VAIAPIIEAKTSDIISLLMTGLAFLACEIEIFIMTFQSYSAWSVYLSRGRGALIRACPCAHHFLVFDILREP
jgi:hypothetical protein